MAMDFFERQDHARRQTVKLIVLFGLSVAVIIVAVYAVALLITQGGGNAHGRHARGPDQPLGPGAAGGRRAEHDRGDRAGKSV